MCTRHTGTVWSHLSDLFFLLSLLRLVVLHLLHNMGEDIVSQSSQERKGLQLLSCHQGAHILLSSVVRE